jgi:hypothetical protein
MRTNEYNQDAIKTRDSMRDTFISEQRKHYGKVLKQNKEWINCIPDNMLTPEIYSHLMRTRTNNMNRTIRNQLHAKSLHEWQLPHLKDQVEEFREQRERNKRKKQALGKFSMSFLKKIDNSKDKEQRKGGKPSLFDQLLK